MHIFRTIDEMRGWSAEERRAGRQIAFVPTMGALHEGHLSLLRNGKDRADSLVVSIYINPTQFGPNEDLDKYPRTLDDDLSNCEAEGAHAVFLPTDKTIYPEGFQTYVAVEGITKSLCGASRPDHFKGVTTVVSKLFNIVTPDVAIFGEKDYQQLAVIRRMVKDLDMPIDIIGCPIVRENDGIAMSSRNKYLSPKERASARSLFASLNSAEEMIEGGETETAKIVSKIEEIITKQDQMRIDYVKIVDADTLEEISNILRPALIALAVFAGNTRLIDNRCLK